MKLKLIPTGLLLAGFAMPAGDPPGFFMWTAAALRALPASLAPKTNPTTHVASGVLNGFGNYLFMVVHREGPAEAEYHATQADILVVQSGEGTLTYGGTMVNAQTTQPNEMRAPGIAGGTDRKIATGDILTIPAKTPHQVNVQTGKEITYFVVKVTQ